MAAFRALEGYLVLGGVEVIQPHVQAIALALERTINIIANTLAASRTALPPGNCVLHEYRTSYFQPSGTL